MKELYQYIATVLATAQDVKAVAVWNNQLQSEAKEFSMSLPAIYFSATVQWTPLTSGSRRGDASLNVYIATEIYETSQDVAQAIAYMGIVDDVYRLLTKAGFESMGDKPDENHDNVQVHQSSYAFTYVDEQLKGTNKGGKKYVKLTPNLIIDK